MPRIPRKQLVDPTEVGIFHCITRCVRRAFLCGVDPLTLKDFSHRRQWIQDRLEFMAGEFAVDLLGFAIMSNHAHVVLRIRPDVVRGWSDEEVARRWWNLFPLRKDEQGNPAEPQPWELAMVTGDPERLAEVRSRLSSLSWFMRCLAEPIARIANREDQVSGRFWQGRYQCQPILDESALAACLAYVDLNPIRACMADTPETSQFTSAYERIHAMASDTTGVDEPGEQLITIADDCADDHSTRQSPPDEPTCKGRPCSEPPAPCADVPRAGEPRTPTCLTAEPCVDWLSPFQLDERDSGRIPSAASTPRARASNTGCLPMTFAAYLTLLDWTGRQLRSNKSGAIPSDLAPILDRLGMNEAGWLRMVNGFSRLFRRAAGKPASLRREAEKWGKRRLTGIAHSRAVFG
jgi:REP element-mobilizing transposase RayT